MILSFFFIHFLEKKILGLFDGVDEDNDESDEEEKEEEGKR